MESSHTSSHDTKALVNPIDDSLETDLTDSLPSLDTTSSSEVSTSKKCCHIPVSPWPVYATAALFFLTLSINETTLNATLYNKVCYQKYQDIELCSNKTFTQSHPELQDDQAKWNNYIYLVELPCAIVTNLILSSYCDKIGHKLPMVMAITGNMLSSMYLALLATKQFLTWPMASVLVYGALNRILGGFSLVIMAEFSYVALITSMESRAFHMAVAEGTLGFGMLIGNTINGFIIDDLGLDALAYMTAGIAVLPLILSMVFMRDVVHTSGRVTPSWRDVVGFDHVLDAFKTVYKKREGYNRLLLNLSFVLYSFPFIANIIFASGAFLYFVKEVGFSMSEFSVFNGIRVASVCFGGPILILIVKKIKKVGDLDFAMGCTVVLALAMIIMSQPGIPYGLWVGCILTFPQGCMYALVRTIQTKICGRDELGRLFAFDAIMQCVLTTAMAIGAKVVYTESLIFWPSLFIALCGFMMLCAMIVIVVMSLLRNLHDSMSSPLTLRPQSDSSINN